MARKQAMTTQGNVLDRLEHDIDLLTLGDQLILMERLARRIREKTQRQPLASVLSEMANDMDIQKELRAIESEFAPTEGDGFSA
jgi:hypothetical protein